MIRLTEALAKRAVRPVYVVQLFHSHAFLLAGEVARRYMF